MAGRVASSGGGRGGSPDSSRGPIRAPSTSERERAGRPGPPSPSARGVPAVDVQRRAGDVGGVVGGQEQDARRDLGGRRRAAEHGAPAELRPALPPGPTR